VRGLLHVPVLTHAAAGVGACAVLIAFVMYRPSLHSRNVASVSPALLVADTHETDTPLPPAHALPASTETEVGRHWLSPRLEQLGVLPRWRAAAIGLDDRRLLWELQESVGELWIGQASSGEHDAIILGVSSASELAQLAMLEQSLKAGGVLWVLHPVNDASITRQAIKAAARDANLSYVASTRLTSTAIAEKLVRQRAPRSRT
jgi:hypothetical protein